MINGGEVRNLTVIGATAVGAADFGLAAHFYGQDPARVWQSAATSFGGVNSSGSGRKGSRPALDDNLDIKYICKGGIDPAEEA
jgi:succinate-semialdehyde dehydrogenase/glutarate-semialdehyde dehydrogenase